MSALVIGIVIWCVVHLVPSVAPSLRRQFVGALGANGYRGAFFLFILVSITLIVIGWRSIPIAAVYGPVGWGRTAALPLVFVAFVLFAASALRTNVKRFIRHPQLTGLAVWAGAHLLSNGENRSLVLFGSLGAWALLEMFFISRREGAWVRPSPEGLTAEVKPLLAGALAFALFLVLHPYLFGVSPLLGGLLAK